MTETSPFAQRIDLLIRQGWKLTADKNQLCRDYSLSNFKSAFALMQRVASQAETMNHHPDWSNSYNQLRICLTTHSAGTLTLKDIELAEFIESQAQVIAQQNQQEVSGEKD